MMKMKSIKTMLVLSLMIALSYTSYGQSSVAPVLSEKDKQISAQFKSLQGQDRVAVFQQLQHLVRVKGIDKTNPVVASSLMGAKATTVNDLITLLGNPTSRVNQTILVYALKTSSNSCKLVVGIDKEGNVVFCTIKDCQ